MSLHAAARTALSAWQPFDERQAALRAEYLGHLDARTDAVWRSCRPAHLTASAVILDETNAHTLLVLHAKFNLWVQPGGHCEKGDSSLAGAAAREIKEETGISDFRLSSGPVVLSRHGAACGAQTHYDVQYCARTARDATLTVSDESHDVRWFPIGRLPDLLAGGVPESVAAAVASVAAGSTSAATP